MKKHKFNLLYAILPLFVVTITIFIVLLASPWSAEAWSRINNIKGPVQIADNGNVIALLSERTDLGDKVLILDKDGNRVWDFAREKNLNSISLSGNGKYLAVGGNNIYLLSLADKRLLWSYTLNGGTTTAINPEGTWLVAGGYDSKIYAFRRESSQVAQKWDLGRREDRPKAVAISGDGKLAAASTNQAFYVFDTTSSAIKWKANTNEYIQKIQISDDGKYLLGIASNSVYYWSKDSSTPLWQKQWRGSLIGADMSSNGDKVAVSSQKELVILNNKGKELRHFEAGFGNSDLQMSSNGRYIYVNNGDRRLYAFDDSYSNNKLRPFRIIQDINAGGHSKTVIGSGSGNFITYPVSDDIEFKQINPSILALSPGIPLLIKDGIVDLGIFVTNPSISSQTMSAQVRLNLPVSAAWWTSITRQTTDRDSSDVKSKMLNYAIDNLPGSSKVYDSPITVAAGSSKESHFTITVPDLASGSSFADQLAGGLSSLSPASLISQVLGKIKGPLAKLVGDDAANLAISTTSRAISAGAGQMVYPTLGMGTVVLYDAQGKFYDQDSFYFIYLR